MRGSSTRTTTPPKRSQNDPKPTPIRSQNDPKPISKRPQDDPKTTPIPRRSQNYGGGCNEKSGPSTKTTTGCLKTNVFLLPFQLESGSAHSVFSAHWMPWRQPQLTLSTFTARSRLTSRIFQTREVVASARCSKTSMLQAVLCRFAHAEQRTDNNERLRS